jgi:hypothetical protein
MFLIGLTSAMSIASLLDVKDVLDQLNAPDKRKFVRHKSQEYIAFEFDDERKAEQFRFRFNATRLPNARGNWWEDLAQ